MKLRTTIKIAAVVALLPVRIWRGTVVFFSTDIAGLIKSQALGVVELMG